MEQTIEVRPADGVPWPDVEAVFAGPGDAAGCSCQWFRLSGRDFAAASPEQRRARLRSEVAGGPPGPGVVAYRGEDPVGWCGVGPAQGYPRLTRSPLLRGVDAAPWVITCFVVPVPHRGRGVATALLTGAVYHAREQGVEAVDALPVDTAVRTRVSAADLYHGPLHLFLAAGFIEVARPSPARAVVRLRLR